MKDSFIADSMLKALHLSRPVFNTLNTVGQTFSALGI